MERPSLLVTWPNNLFTKNIKEMTFSQNDRLGSTNDLKTQLSRLDKQLISYKVIARQGISKGEVKDIYYDANNELNLLVKLIEVDKVDNQVNLRRLKHQDICQLDLDDKSILSNLSSQQIENLPIYQAVPEHLKEALSKSPLYDDCQMNPVFNSDREQSTTSDVYQISLLEEKLQVARRKQKVGEVIVRKEVETRMVKVPIRREKLIVERIGKNPERLTEVVIAEEKVNGFKYEDFNHTESLHITKSHFLDVQTAQQLLEAIAQLSSAANATVRLEIVTNSSEHQIKHQGVCDRYK